jgi:hypothetical protein
VSDFLTKRRWQVARYPHDLGRRRHFGESGAYIPKHDAREVDLGAKQLVATAGDDTGHAA